MTNIFLCVLYHATVLFILLVDVLYCGMVVNLLVVFCQMLVYYFLHTGANNEEQNGWEGLWEMVSDLVMWKNVGRSAFWFGSGSMLFVSSSFSRGMNFRHAQLLLYFYQDIVPLVTYF